ncbi:MFS transporter [Actinocorallia longicatena]|uniref:MFS transporter n=1 Tax=Actinocorallia longicatena TaxID=111803 RepID=A0ABP6PZC7_9ACTN
MHTQRLMSPRIVGISLGYFMVMIDATILNVALPDISRDLGGSVTSQQWTVSAYALAFGALLLSSGAVADRFGATRVFRFGIAAFAAASLLCALAPSLWLLIALRAVQGAAAASVPASTLALLGLMYPEAGERARAVGLWAALTGIGFAAGPMLGGILVEAGGWRTVFLVNLPVAVAGLLLSRGLGVETPGKPTRLDPRSQLAAIAALALLTDTVIELPHGGALVPGLLTVVAAAALVAAERRSPAPAFPPVLTRIRDIRTALTIGVFIQFQMVGGLFVLGLYFLDARHFSALETGFAFVPLTVGPMLAPAVGRLTGRLGARRLVRTGLTLTVAGNALIAAAVLTEAPFPLLIAAMIVMGWSVPFSMVPLTAQLVGAAPAGTGGTAGGLFNAVRQIGGALGVAVLGALVASYGPADGTGYALAVSAVLTGAVLLGLVASDLRVVAAAPVASEA